jgi:hypothetical protein
VFCLSRYAVVDNASRAVDQTDLHEESTLVDVMRQYVCGSGGSPGSNHHPGALYSYRFQSELTYVYIPSVVMCKYCNF